tara:strand:+ start:7 stop:297 length:291 start_codon:yes stop_codon:yes gene_type:complete
MKTLTIPRKVKVGKRWYSVEILEAMCNKQQAGRVFFDTQTIQVGRHTKQSEMDETFWHELVHAILHDMEEHKLNDRETFVEDFAHRLAKAIKSARF